MWISIKNKQHMIIIDFKNQYMHVKFWCFSKNKKYKYIKNNIIYLFFTHPTTQKEMIFLSSVFFKCLEKNEKKSCNCPNVFLPWEEKRKIALGGNTIKNHDYFSYNI